MTVMDRFGMDGKVALVTGAACGIGEQFSVAMAEAGADVVLADIDEESASETAKEIEEKTDSTAVPMEVDVTDKNQVDAAVEATVEEFGSPNVAFANAGIAELEGQVSNYSPEQWKRILDVNLNGVFYTTVRQRTSWSNRKKVALS